METELTPAANQELTPVSWDEFLQRFSWRQGEHLTVIGPTGRGKTHLIKQLLPMRRCVVIVATKPNDPLLDQFKADGYKVVRSLPLPPPEFIAPRVVFWPRNEDAGDIPKQQVAIRDLLLQVYRNGGYAVYFNEIHYVTKFLKLEPLVDLLYRQGRSLGVTVIAAAQRPFHIPLVAYDQARHVFFFQENDDTNLRRIGSIGSIANRAIRQQVARLETYQVLYLNTLDGTMMVTTAPPE